MAAPVITVQPKSINVIQGAPFSLEVMATGGASLSYQWFKNGSAITGATGVALKSPIAAASYSGSYTVTITDGVSSVSSAPATLTVTDSAPVITREPSSYTGFSSAAPNEPQISAAVAGSQPMTFQWYRNNIAVTPNPTSYVNPFSTVLKLKTAADSGDYKIVFRNAFGEKTSRIVQVKVAEQAPQIIGQPKSVSSGPMVTARVFAEGSLPISFQWYKDGTVITGATGASYSATGTIGETHVYDVVVKNVYGNVRSNAVTHTFVSPAPAETSLDFLPIVITKQPLAQSLQVGQRLELSVGAQSSRPLTYQWNRNGAALTGATSSSYILPSVGAADAGDYQVIVRDSAVGNFQASEWVKVSVLNGTQPAVVPLRFEAQPLAKTANFGVPVLMSCQVSGTGPIQYQWYKDGVPIGSNNSFVFGEANSAAGTYKVVVSNSSQTLTSREVKITVLNQPVVVPALKPLSVEPRSAVAAPGSVDFSLLAVSYMVSLNMILPLDVVPSTYQWYVDDVPVPNMPLNRYFHATPAVSKPSIIKYSVLVSNSTGNTLRSVDVLLDPTLPMIGTLSSRMVKEGSPLTLSVGAQSNRSMSYQWYKDNQPIAGATNENYQIDSATAATAGRYRVKVSTLSGSAETNDLYVVVVPANVQYPPPVIVVQPASITSPSSSDVQFKVEAAGMGQLSYKWFKNGVAITPQNSPGPVYSFTPTGQSDEGVYHVEVTSDNGTIVASKKAKFTLAVPAPVPSTTNSKAIKMDGGF